MLSAAFAASALFASATANSLLPRNDQVPVAPCAYPYTAFLYSGCYIDNPPGVGLRALPFATPLEFNNMTVEACTAECKSNGYRYAGLEYYGQCYCGASISSAAAPEAECNFACNGNANEICGGQERLSIYQDPTFPDADNIVESDAYASLGCYTEGTSGRALEYSQYDFLDGTVMTTELCLDTCGAKGYPYAGTEFGGECYCGVVLGNGTVPAADQTQCNMPCNGNADEVCGGPSLLNLYVAKNLESAEPCAPPPVSSVVVPSSSIAPPSSVASSTFSTATTSCSIPSNSYTAPPAPSTTPSSTITPTPAPTSSCLCATPSAWAGSKAVAGYQMPCVGCNDVASQRSSKPFKLFNSKNFGQCPAYPKGKQTNACQDSCKTQYDWCLSYANSCRYKNNAPESFQSANFRCRKQFADCYASNKAVKDDGRCNTTGSNTPATKPEFYSWCKQWLGQWFKN
ncbi:WSC-domain-containing protein [Aulographum hederae CBS 113979]|uniref:WSC-domain-containing protein n=1 Tax=Aulographum hederae CBS 113979 TaxID=1176131 RepID=A0A6G1H1V2_9PEZI|nr:WSC-domain-containing protein [Aulographum hederae CBS 113979]